MSQDATLLERKERWERNVFALDLAGLSHMAHAVLTAVYNGQRLEHDDWGFRYGAVATAVATVAPWRVVEPEPWPHDDAAALLAEWRQS